MINGVVIDLEVLFFELEALRSRGIETSRLRVSANAHIITQYHRTLDKVTERFLGKREANNCAKALRVIDRSESLTDLSSGSSARRRAVNAYGPRACSRAAIARRATVTHGWYIAASSSFKGALR